MPQSTVPTRRPTSHVSLRFPIVLVAASLVWGCGGDDGPGPVVQMVSIVAGDGQTGPAGDVVSQDFTVRVTGSDSEVLQGVTVTWGVGQGGGSMSPASGQTDASGLASARLTLGNSPGSNTVTASVSGGASVTFAATAIDPCDFARSHAVGDTYVGSLRFPDCTLGDNTFIDFYALDLPSQQALEITLTSSAFNAFIFLINDVPETVAADDDGFGVGTDSRLPAILPAGFFAIGANSFVPGTGAYTLSTAAITEDVTDCEFVWVTGGVNTMQSVTATDCEVTTDLYADVFPLFVRSGTAVAAVQRSTAIDAYLELFDTDGALLASDDNGGGGTDAEVVWVATSDVVILISASTAAAMQTGAYTLSVVVAPPQQAVASPGTVSGSRIADLTRRPGAEALSMPAWSRTPLPPRD